MKHPWSSRRLVVLGVCLVVLQGVCAVWLFWGTIDLGYRVGGLSSVDQLGRLGGGPAIALGAVVLPPLLGVPLAVVLLFTRFRRRAWVVPAAGMIASAVVWLWAVSTFERVPAVIGG